MKHVWVPAFAGMTLMWWVAAAGLTQAASVGMLGVEVTNTSEAQLCAE